MVNVVIIHNTSQLGRYYTFGRLNRFFLILIIVTSMYDIDSTFLICHYVTLGMYRKQKSEPLAHEHCNIIFENKCDQYEFLAHVE